MQGNDRVFGRKPSLLPVTFTGTAGQYFAIWIVNVLLTIVTFGLWWPWAKVRRRRYFLGNTFIDGESFDYLATGWQLFKGLLVALLIVGLTSGLGALNPLFQLVISPLFIVAMPWVVNRSLRFNARMTMWRNVRFDFEGSYWRTAMVLYLYPFLTVITFGLAAPFTLRWTGLYFARRHRFGTARFDAEARKRDFALAVLISVAVFAAVAFVLGMIAGTAAYLIAGPESIASVIPIAVVIGIYAAQGFLLGETRAIIIRGLTLGGSRHRFATTLNGWAFAWITVSNIFATLLSLGLLRPWAEVRLWRYQAEALTVKPSGAVDAFIDHQRGNVSAVGDEMADVLGVEFGI